MYANQVLNRNANTGLSNIEQQYCQNGRKEIKNHETTERRKACCQKSGKLQTQLNSSIPITGGGAIFGKEHYSLQIYYWPCLGKLYLT